jgi:hypothetical protein
VKINKPKTVKLFSDFDNFGTTEFNKDKDKALYITNNNSTLPLFLTVDIKNLLELEQFVHDINTYIKTNKGE